MEVEINRIIIIGETNVGFDFDMDEIQDKRRRRLEKMLGILD